jgi:hypothetical protein
VRALLLSLLLATGCLVTTRSPGVIVCEDIDYEAPTCAGYYDWVPGYWIGGIWSRGHYVHHHRGPRFDHARPVHRR